MMDAISSATRLNENFVAINVRNQQLFHIFATDSNIKSAQPRRISKWGPQPSTTSVRKKMTTRIFSTPQERWSAIVSRNPDAAAAFVYAVKTTGIYCRPDCKARLARRANILFFDSGPLAEEAGYRACKRCKPELLASQQEDPLFGKIRHAVYLVEDHASRGQKISLGSLSQQVGLSKWHLLRVFRRIQGLSPHEMATAIINALETEVDASQESGMPQAESDTAAGTEVSPGEAHPPMTASWNAQGLGTLSDDWGGSDNAEVDDVLRDLFPELYSDVTG
jgi:methylphosphotriester-DNA--protein-cysteine methyltransferase